MSRNIVSSVLSVVSAKVVTLAIGLVTSPLLYRMLGPAKFGEYATVLSAHALFMIFVSSGITRGVRKYVAEERHLPDWEGLVIGFYFRLAVGLAAAGGLVYLLAVKSGAIAWLFDPTFEPYFTLMIGAVVSAQLWSFSRRALMGLGLEHYSEPLSVVYWLAFAGIALGLVSQGYGVIGALAGQMLGTLLAALIAMVLIVRRVSARALVQNTHPGFPRDKIFAYNTGTIALSFLVLSLYHVDVIMLQNLRGGDMVGHYKAALKLAEFLWFVPATIQAVYVHSTSEMWSKGQVDRVANIASKTTRYTLLLTVLMGLGLASLAETVVPLYWGRDATPVIKPLLLLLPGALGFAAVRPTLAIEEGHGTLRYALRATGAAALINVVLNALLIPFAGMEGAAVATSVGYGSMFVFHIWSASKLGFNPIRDARILRIAVTAGISAVPIFLLPTVLPDLVALVVVPPVGLAVFATLAFATGALDVEECWDLLTAFPGPIPGLVERARDPQGPALMSKRAVVNSQRWLALVGILLFVAGTGFAVGTAVLDDGGNESANVTATETRVPAETSPGTTSSDAGTDDTTAPGATGEPDQRERGSETIPATDTASRTDDDSDDDDDGGFGGGGGGGGSGGSGGSDETETDETETPDDSNETETPDDGEETETPDDGNETETPDDGDETETPDDGNETETPDDGNETETPDDGDETETPDDGNETETPDDGGDTETPDDGGDTETPDDGDGTETPNDGDDTETPDDGGETDTPDGGTESPGDGTDTTEDGTESSAESLFSRLFVYQTTGVRADLSIIDGRRWLLHQ